MPIDSTRNIPSERIEESKRTIPSERLIGDERVVKYTKSLLHFNSDFADDAGKIWTPTGAIINTVTKKFGAGSVYLDGVDDYITTPDSADWDLSATAGDFTIECWAYPTASVGNSSCLMSLGGTYFQSSGLLFGYHPENTTRWVCYGSPDGVNWNVLADAKMGDISVNTWQHIALVRSGNTYYGFKNGVLGPSFPLVNSAGIYNPVSPLFIGKSTITFQGYIDEFRFSRGIARWTADFSANLPTSEYGTD